MTDDKEFLNWVADRLVNVYGANKNIDFVQHLREIASDKTGLKLFECRRSESNGWEGAVIVYAENGEEANIIANGNDHICKTSDKYYVKELKLVKGVIYDDLKR